MPLFATSLDALPRAASAEAIDRVVRSGRYILGPEVEAFEPSSPPTSACEHCVGVANGTDALTIALRALGVGPGDEVVMPVVHLLRDGRGVPSNAGAPPVFCDVDPDTFCVTAETVQRGAHPAHEGDRAGRTCSATWRRCRAARARRAGARGRRAGRRRDARRRQGGALGDAATFSFFPSKNLRCLGDGGAIVTDDDDVAERARRLRFHGSTDKVTFTEVGYNSRLDELQAAVLRVLLPELDGWNDGRRARRARLRDGRAGRARRLPRAGRRRRARLPPLRGPPPDADGCAALGAGIGARGYYRVPVHRQPAMADFAPASSCRGPRRPPARTSRCRWAPMLDRASRSREVVRGDARLGRPDEQPARARHAAR